MSYKQVRINKTKELQEVLDYLQTQYKSLSEADLFKTFLVQEYVRLHQQDPLRQSLLLQASQVFQVDQDDEPDNIAEPRK